MYRVAFAAFAGLCVSSHPVALECGTTRLEVGQTIMGSPNIAGAAADGVNFTIADASVTVRAAPNYYMHIQNVDAKNVVVKSTCPWVVPNVNCTAQSYTPTTPLPPGGECVLTFAAPVAGLNVGYTNSGPPVKIFNLKP